MSEGTAQAKEGTAEEILAVTEAAAETVEAAVPLEPKQELTPHVVMELVSQGQRVLGQGRAEEALTLAESVLEDMPNSVSALALKGDALERLGDYAGALETYEKVLELKPDSALDRIRANQLKRQLQDPELEESYVPTHKRSLLMGAAAAMFVLAVGIPIIWAFTQPQRNADSTEVASGGGGFVAENFPNIAPVPSGANDPNGQRSAIPPSAQDAVQRQTNDGRTQSSVVGPGSYTPPSGSSRLQGTENLGEIQPINPGGPTDITVQPSRPPISDPRPDPGINPDDPTPITDSSTPKREDPGIINIQPSATSGSGSGSRVGNTGSQEASGDDEAARQSSETLIRVARDAFVKGDYARAADAYEKALRQGASRGSTNQRLAQCYERLGRKSDAIAAYERAIAAYQATLSSGSGDSSRVQAALDTCRQALKNLRG
jgi:tetratricopeptide (TPR) repeat protein